MKKVLKILAIILAILVVLWVGCYIAVRSFLTSDFLRSTAEKMVSDATNYPVEIGNVKLKFGFKISISIDGLEITNAPPFTPGNMLSIKKINLSLKLIPLLRRQIEIGSIDIDGLELKLEKDKNGNYNIALPSEERKQTANWSLALKELNIRRGNVSYQDAVTKLQVYVKNLNQSIRFRGSHLLIDGEQTVSVTIVKDVPELNIKLKNILEYDTITKSVNLKELKATYEPLEMKVSGTIEKSEILNLRADLQIKELANMISLIPKKYNLEKLSGSVRADATVLGSTKEPKLNGKCELSNITVKIAGVNRNIEKINGSFAFDLNAIRNIIIQGIVGTSRFDISGSISNPKQPVLDILIRFACNLKDIEALVDPAQGVKLNGMANLNITIKGSAAKPSCFGDYTISEATIDGIGIAKPITNLRARGSIQNDGAKIAECTFHIGHSDFSLNGHISNFSKPVVQINNTSNLIDLDELLPKEKTARKTEQKGVPVSIQGNVRINKLSGIDMEFRNINTFFSYENGIVDLKNCRAETFDGNVQFDLYYNSNSPEPYRINTRMENISAQRILKRLLKFDNLQGKLSGVNNFQGKGFTQKEVVANLNASGNVKLVNGLFNNFDFFNKLFAWLGYEDRKVLHLNDLMCSFKIVNGKTSIEDWSMSTGIGNFLTNGTIRLDGAINLTITLTLNKNESDILKKKNADWLLYYDSSGRATIDILATGKLFSPHFSLDTNKIKERLKGKIKDEYDKKKKELEKKLKDMFK